ncbi:translesion DNA synthesis-associated protein ImuA [Paraburkholderia sp. SARCC-3016]|uniref:translesion DNA synthesis-associated protein ImuA n=1 Tax=Paraburkholderia sp. SARCC-3016 TaxID=3058611 RepID=UPI0028099759|nr:translesion DNA synthesis-associated protein ImuA [Paraburkholderia sp. SARCC-3016]MDQ7979870.1 translesion DNA synthesis-associated protein ImuA [Paraburkholderia sp. SARCC-3016]
MCAALMPEAIHPDLWKGNQLARAASRVVPCGDESLAAELPGGGWPRGALTDLLVQQTGCGELRLLRPAFERLGSKPIVLLQPPHDVQPTAFAWWGLDPSNLLTVKATKTADALWAAEQILRAGTCGALVFWQQHVRPEAVRRLHLAAQTSESLFLMVRPLATTRDASPAPLRLAIRPAKGGVDVQFLKRRGPARDEPLFVALTPSPILNVKRNATVDRRPSPVVVPRSVPAEVVA